MLLSETNDSGRSHDEAGSHVLVLHTTDVNKLRDTTSHYRVALVSIVALPGIMGERNPILVLPDAREEVNVRCIVGEMTRVTLYAIACGNEGIGDNRA